MIDVDDVTPFDRISDVIKSPKYGWLTIHDVEEIDKDPDAMFAFRYYLNGIDDYTILVRPTDGSVALINEDCYSIDPASRQPISDSADPVGYPLYRWKGFDLSMIDDDYYDESKRQTRRPVKSESTRKLARRVRR